MTGPTSPRDRAARGGDRRGLWRIMFIMGMFLLFVQINRTGGAVLATALRDMHGLAPATIGLVTGAMFLASAAIQLPVGLMLDRFGPRRMVTSLSFLAIAGMALFAVATDALGLTAARILIGFGLVVFSLRNQRSSQLPYSISLTLRNNTGTDRGGGLPPV